MKRLTLREKYWVLNGFRLIEIICMFSGGFLGITNHMLYFMLSVVAILFYRQHSRMVQIYKAGLVGEKKAGRLLKGLPKAYIKKHNVRISLDGHQSELDYVVIGPTGVYVIEVKNMSGSIRGFGDSQQWVQNKVLKNGKPFVYEFYSPVKQVQTHAKRLGKLLNYGLECEEKIWVQPLVLFVHDEVRLELHDMNTPVFTEIEALIHFILNRKVKYSKKQIRDILSEI